MFCLPCSALNSAINIVFIISQSSLKPGSKYSAMRRELRSPFFEWHPCVSLRCTGGGRCFAPRPSPPAAAPHPIPSSRWRPLRGKLLSHHERGPTGFAGAHAKQFPAKRAPPIPSPLGEASPPPAVAGCPLIPGLKAGFAPPLARAPPMHLAAHHAPGGAFETGNRTPPQPSLLGREQCTVYQRVQKKPSPWASPIPNFPRAAMRNLQLKVK